MWKDALKERKIDTFELLSSDVALVYKPSPRAIPSAFVLTHDPRSSEIFILTIINR